MRDAWRLTSPYFRSEEKGAAWALLIGVLAMNLSLVAINVIFSYWNREFFNTLQQKDATAFLDLLLYYRKTESGLMPGYVYLIAVYVGVAVYARYVQQWLEMRWRRWLTAHYLDQWLADRAYYRLSLNTDHAAYGTDNPDQRIAEDLREFTRRSLDLTIGLMREIVSLFSFLTILWGLSGVLELFGVTIPGYMVWVALIYALFGTWITHLVGRALVGLRFRQERVEADFRYSLVRLRENVEGVALYGGEREERGYLNTRFGNIVDNWWAIIRRNRLLNLLVISYDYAVVVFPYIVAAPRFFSGQIPLGGLSQTAAAFSRVHHALSWFVNSYSELARWRAEVARLATFSAAVAAARAEINQSVIREEGDAPTLRLQGLDLALPDGTRLLAGAELELPAGRSVLVSGRSGSGKSTLFRALAGIWPFGAGRVVLPRGQLLFLPQRTYIPLGSLKYVVCYPDTPDRHDKTAIAAALTDAGLAHLVARLDEDENWALRLSGGEQQRIALARALLARPDWLFLDEATASLDTEAEDSFYRVLREKLPGCTVVSIAHRPTVAAYHEDCVRLEREPGQVGRLTLAAPIVAGAG